MFAVFEPKVLGRPVAYTLTVGDTEVAAEPGTAVRRGVESGHLVILFGAVCSALSSTQEESTRRVATVEISACRTTLQGTYSLKTLEGVRTPGAHERSLRIL